MPRLEREDDERVLRWLRMAEKGMSRGQIAKREKVTRNIVCGALWRVERDLAASEGAE